MHEAFLQLLVAHWQDVPVAGSLVCTLECRIVGGVGIVGGVVYLALKYLVGGGLLVGGVAHTAIKTIVGGVSTILLFKF